MKTDYLLWIYLVVNTISDIRTKKVNVLWSLLFTFGGIMLFVCGQEKDILSFIGGFLTGISLLFLAYVSKEAVGWGDGFVVTAVGIWLGFGRTLMILMGGLLLAAGYGLIKIMLKKADRKSELAFIPFFSLAYSLLYAGGML